MWFQVCVVYKRISLLDYFTDLISSNTNYVAGIDLEGSSEILSFVNKLSKEVVKLVDFEF